MTRFFLFVSFSCLLTAKVKHGFPKSPLFWVWVSPCKEKSKREGVLARPHPWVKVNLCSTTMFNKESQVKVAGRAHQQRGGQKPSSKKGTRSWNDVFFCARTQTWTWLGLRSKAIPAARTKVNHYRVLTRCLQRWSLTYMPYTYMNVLRKSNGGTGRTWTYDLSLIRRLF